MLRELLDPAFVEDFTDGLARACGLRVLMYDSQRELITASPPTSAYARLVDCLPQTLPMRLEFIRLPADEPPAQVAVYGTRGASYVLAPVYVGQLSAGFIGVGEVRRTAEADGPVAAGESDAAARTAALHALPLLDEVVDARPVRAVRWAARLLSEWCRRELRAAGMAEQLALVGDLATLLTGEQDLQPVLDRIVAETARVMKVRFCSLRLYNEQTNELTIKAGYNLSPRYLSKGQIRRSDSPIDDEALSGNVVYVEDAARDPRFQFPEDAQREGIVSVLTTGLHYRGRPVGVMRVYTDRRQVFRRGQRDLLRAVAAQAATASVSARLLEERLRSAETERQLALAGQIQARRFDAPPPQHPCLQTARVFSPSSHVSGDFCDFVTFCDGRFGVVVADVVGKGVPAALLGASLRGALRAGTEACLSLGELFERLNRHVCRETTPSEFVTMLMVALSPDGRVAEYCSAGHEPLLLLRDDVVRPVHDAGLVLGVEPTERYTAHRLELRPHDFLLLYTDGAIDAVNFADEAFGRPRLHEALRQYGQLEPQQVLRNIMWDIRRFIGLAEQVDDLTMVGLRCGRGGTGLAG